jgi:bifunctional non-homologous end joining protein LigD
MGLREYHRKRDFAVTPEPKGTEAPERDGARSFCIQKHAATRLHYDFRLEMEGVLKSWAVPKGPSYDPADKRLAMQTEDHPIEYGDFEGIIPAGEYGGGTVLLWDRGTWEPVEDPHKGLRAGSLKFRLKGEKLEGRWALVKIKGKDARDDAKSWLLIKEKDDHVRPSAEWSVTEARPESVATGRTLEEVAEERDRVWHSNRAEKGPAKPKGRFAVKAKARARTTRKDFAALAAKVPGARKRGLPRAPVLQLATLVGEPPQGDDWLHEMKFDGYRIAAALENGEARLTSRNGNDWTAQFPGVAEDVEGLPARSALIDGEVAVVLPSGTTSFQALQNAMGGGGGGEIVYFAFDLLHLEGYDLTAAPLEERKKALSSLLSAAGGTRAIRFSDHVVGEGEAFFKSACGLGLEGIISKRRDARYEGGRGRSWLKVKCLRRQEFVIGGWTDPEGSRVGIGALLLGVYDAAGALAFAGKVGTGFTAKTLRDLEKRLAPLARPSSPFARARIPGVTRAHWVEPELVAEVRFTEWTGDGRLRHPSFQALREDKKAREVVREREAPAGSDAPKAAAAPRPARARSREGEALHRKAGSRSRAGKEAEVAGVKLTNADRVVFDGPKVTKLDLARYYERIADRILPQIAGRPLTLVRGPEGASKPTFYMKHSGVWAPKALRRVDIQERTKVGEYLVVDDLSGLVSLVQMGILEIHTWNSTASQLEKPDRVVFDLDPDPSVPWTRVADAARLLRARLEDLGFASFLKTTGGKGLHIVVPLRPGATWEDSFAFTRGVSEQIERAAPREFTTEIPKAARKGKILIDYLRNNRGNTSVAAYSTRAKPPAPVSTPITWDELTSTLRPDQYTLANIDERLRRLKKDPWADYGTVRQRLTAAARKAAGA